MDRFKKFFRASFIGGIVVLLPIVIFIAAFRWLVGAVTNLIQPMTNILVLGRGMPEVVADLIVFLLIVLICFAIGSLVSTGGGRYLHGRFDQYLVRLAPGYKLIREIVLQFFGDEQNSPFANGEIARARIFGNEAGTEVTAIVTSRHADGTLTVFVPTGPNPTSGNMYHLPPAQVTLVPEASLEDAMRTIIACGAGSASLFGQGRQKTGENGDKLASEVTTESNGNGSVKGV